jgi:cell division ATPase FtsA
VVDIGGGTTEVAAVAGWRVVRAQSLRKAGNAMDEAVVQAARTELGLIISQRTARQLKMTLGVTGGPDGGWIVASALDPIVAAIAGTVAEILSDIPPGLAEDVVRGKIRLAGGGALLPGLAARIETVAGIGTVVVEDPLRCVVRGAAEILERGPQARHAGVPGLRQLIPLTGTMAAGGNAPGFPPVHLPVPPPASLCGRPHSSGWRAIVAGSRPASSQPAAVATSGRPTRMASRFHAGT